MTAGNTLNPIEEGEEDVNYVEAYKNNVADVQNYLQSVLGENNPHTAFNAHHLEDLLAAVHTNDFWDDLFSAKSGDVANNGMPNTAVQSLTADLSGITLNPVRDQHEKTVADQTDSKTLLAVEHVEAIKLLAQELEQLRDSWTQVSDCDEGEIITRINPAAVLEQVGEFVQDLAFWQELVYMHQEVSIMTQYD
ncbi:hypothetical protein EON64_00825 [archaeon]|nr:MAG: hypothetical protein EON64_00825 [archaeon]